MTSKLHGVVALSLVFQFREERRGRERGEEAEERERERERGGGDRGEIKGEGKEGRQLNL